MPNYTLRRLAVAMIGLVLVTMAILATRSTIEVDCTPGRYTVQEGDSFWSLYQQVCDGDIADLANVSAKKVDPLRPGTVIEVTEAQDIFAKVELARRAHKDVLKEDILYSGDERGERATFVSKDATILVVFIELHSS